jgi:hypothetical protein
MDVQDLSEIPPWEWPAAAAETLLKVLRNREAPADERLRAAEMASSVTVMNEPIAEALLALLRDPDEREEIRGQAAISLGPALEDLDTDLGWEEPDELLLPERMLGTIQNALHRVYLDAGAPKFVRRRALEAAVRAPAEWHAGAVRAAYHSDDEEWRQTALFAMAYVPDFDAEILETLQGPEPALRYEAVRAAGQRGLKKAWRHVKRIVETERSDQALLVAAIEAVGGIRPSAAAEVLADLRDHEDEEIAEAVEEALSWTPAPWEEDDEDW